MDRDQSTTTALTIVIVATIVVGLAAVLMVDGDDEAKPPDPGGNATPSTTAPNIVPQAPGAPPHACNLVSIEAVAKVTGKRLTETEAVPQSGGSLCRYKSPEEGGVALVEFSILVQEAPFARETTEARQGERVGGLGDVAVFDQSEFKSEISVAKGNRYVQLQSQPKSGAKKASKEALADLARQAIAKL